MNPYLDSEDSYYRYNEQSIKEELINVKAKSKKDYAGIGAIIFTFTVISIVIGLSMYTAWQVVYGFKFPDNLAPLPDEIESIMKQYCADSPNGNMTADLVDTGKINSTYSTWNCDYLEEKQKLGEKISKGLQDLMEQLK